MTYGIDVEIVCVAALNKYNLEPAYSTTSVMIYHRGASLSEQHTDLLTVSHCTKQDLSRTSRHVDNLHQR